MSDPLWRIELFGGVRAICGEMVVDSFPTRNTAALLARLSLESGRTHPREELMELFWPESDLDSARHSLRQTLLYLRRSLGDDDRSVIRSDRSGVSVDPAVVAVDTAEFDRAICLSKSAETGTDRIDHLARAASLFRGEPIGGFYDDWVLAARQRLESTLDGALEQLQELLLLSGRAHDAIAWAVRRLQLDPLREESHVALMRLYAATGQPAAIRRQLKELEKVLSDELDESPAPQTVRLADRLVEEALARAARLEKLRSDQAPDVGAAGRSRLAHRPVLAAAAVIMGGLFLISPASRLTEGRVSSNVVARGAESRFQDLAILRERDFNVGAPAGRETAHRRHAEVALSLAEDAWRSWYGPDEERWISMLDASNTDVRTALAWLIENDPARAVRMSGALTRFWYRRDHVPEGYRLLSESLAKCQELTVERARALVGHSFLAPVHDSRCDAECREALAIYTGAGDRWGMAHALRHLGYFASERQHAQEALALYAKALGRFRSIDDPRGEAVTLLCMACTGGLQGQAGKLDRLEQYGRESLEIFRHIGNVWGMTAALRQCGGIEVTVGRPERATAYFAQADALTRRNEPWAVSATPEHFWLDYVNNDWRAVDQDLKRTLEKARSSGDRASTARALRNVACRVPKLRARTRMLAASFAFDRSLGIERDKPDMAPLRRALGDREFASAMRDGARLSWDQAVDEALATLGSPR